MRMVKCKGEPSNCIENGCQITDQISEKLILCYKEEDNTGFSMIHALDLKKCNVTCGKQCHQGTDELERKTLKTCKSC